ncbi:PA2779 family protein [uncultured Pseudodesulfovibrio sp.]|uniref:PA2779 family protein n=1 Tax=uncultured Pseudodesulfovibrio sp. TaxID=2035858 RepID=UPI0029C79F5C|nr:PA2779 family protein [uncultured Pseudodesulfovibrio sp.]
MYNKFSRIVCLTVILSLLVLNVATARAGLVTTEAAMAASRNADNRAMVLAQLQRDDVRQVLQTKGLSVAEVEQRVNALSDTEINQIADRMNDMPAGSGAFGVVIGAVLLVFIILLITDMAGATDVFPFVKKAN